MKILVTGGRGNLGSWITRRLTQDGHEVWTLSRQQVQDCKRHFAVDLSDADQCHKQLNGVAFDVVVHMASANNFASPTFAYEALSVNSYGTRNLVAALGCSNVKHFIYFSTFHVYGASQGLISESTPLAPRNDYGISHLFAEHYVRMFGRVQGLPFTILRLTNSYGCPTSKDTSQWVLLFNDLAKMAAAHQPLKLTSTGMAVRDFLWMGDVSDAVSQLSTQQATNDIYNMSSGKSIRLRDVAEEIQVAYSKKYSCAIEIQTQPGGDSPRVELTVLNEKLAKIIRFHPERKFQEEANAIFEFLAH